MFATPTARARRRAHPSASGQEEERAPDGTKTRTEVSRSLRPTAWMRVLFGCVRLPHDSNSSICLFMIKTCIVLLWDRIADAAAVAHYLGYTGPTGGVCTACGASTYKAATGNAAPTVCPANYQSAQRPGSALIKNCVFFKLNK